ncbi:hypothetical protein [Phenylobacterium sp.]|uniref:hypothetical protein n=1 Tax=Phenylobacterium sp. TaxID=1871053 RepID=UPI002DF26221|nr:hypothetical protein [Phenylobacterium sp.]
MAKKTQTYLPKRIAGVKVPKSVRKGPLGELIASPTGPALLAEAVMIARAKQIKDDIASKKNPPAVEAGLT